jgi:hypothetical protein
MIIFLYKHVLITTFVFVLILAAGCVAHRHAAWQAPPSPFGGVSEEIIADLVKDGDSHWQRREDAREVDEAVRAWTAALRYHPRDPSLYVRLGRAALRRGVASHRREQLDVALHHAEKALVARNPDLAAAARASKPADQVFALADASDAPALALYAEALLAWALAHGAPTVLAQRDAIHAAAADLLRFAPAAGFAAADRVLGTLACALPGRRQDLVGAREHFAAALATAPAYLPTKLAFAEACAARARDKALHRRLLQEIVDADSEALADAAPENREAQRIAARWLGRGR